MLRRLSRKLIIYIFQALLIGVPLFLSIIFAVALYTLYGKLVESTQIIVESGKKEIVREEIEFRKDLFTRILLSVYSELWSQFPEYEKTLLEKNMYTAKKFLERGGNTGELLHRRLMYGSGIVYYVDLNSGRIYHPHYIKRILKVEDVRDDSGEMFILKGVERAKGEGRTFIEYRLKGREKLAYFEYFPEKNIVLITSGSKEELKRNYKFVVKNVMLNIIKAISQITPLILEDSENRVVLSTFSYGNENLPSFELNFPEINWKLKVFVNVPQLENMAFSIVKGSQEIMKDTTIKLFGVTSGILILVVILAVLLGFWLVKEFDTLSFTVVKLATEDSVTGGYNQYGLKTRFDRLNELGFKRAVIALLDVENFKMFNVERRKGDRLLRKIYEYLKGTLTGKFPGTLVGRQGGDRFIVVVPVEDRREEKSAVQMLQALRLPENLWNAEVNLYIVVDVVDTENVDFDRMVNVLFEALKKVKEEKRYFSLLDDKLRKSLEIEEKRYSEFLEAIKEDRITFAIQPIVDADSLTTVGYEVLGRIINNGSAVSIYSYINSPSIRNSALQIEAVKRIVEKALTYKVTNAEKFRGKYFSINISRAFMLFGFYDFITELIEKLNYPVEELVIEVLERDSYSREMADILNRIRKAGIKVAIDDFGVEKANVMNLLKLPADIVKFDGEFLRLAMQDAKARELVRGINRTILNIGNKTVMEMVEDEEMLKLSRELGFSFVQGYAVGRPVVPEKNY